MAVKVKHHTGKWWGFLSNREDRKASAVEHGAFPQVGYKFFR